MEFKLDVMIMSGVEDGTLLKYGESDGQHHPQSWTITIGRRDDNDICLRNDTYVSRQHAKLHREAQQWWLEDCQSTNGTFLEISEFSFDETKVEGKIEVKPGQLFRVGRTWLRIQPAE